MPSTRPLRVLVVDDEPDTVRSTCDLLTLHGFTTDGATSGERALSLASADPPDVALIDLSMPVVDGFEVARRLRALRLPRTPLLIAVTGHSADWDRGQAAAAGFLLYLVKPVPPDELVSLLRQCEESRTEKV
jgi:CheY-like chemotaxis protein